MVRRIRELRRKSTNKIKRSVGFRTTCKGIYLPWRKNSEEEEDNTQQGQAEFSREKAHNH
jgi:hypothetical protein